MANSIDLNIIDESTGGSNWKTSGTAIEADKLRQVKEQLTSNASAMNSIPTPFARWAVVREAFVLVTADRNAQLQNANAQPQASRAYQQLVSDTLDVMELLFRLHHHEQLWDETTHLRILEWDAATQLPLLRQHMPVLGEALHAYYPTDIREEKLFFVVLSQQGKDYLLATSSPYTAFVTPSDLDKVATTENNGQTIFAHDAVYKAIKLPRKSGGHYFRDIRLLEAREADFVNYLYQLIACQQHEERLAPLKAYVDTFGHDSKVNTAQHIATSPVLTIENHPLVVNGLQLGTSAAVSIEALFAKTLVRVPYRIDRENWTTVRIDSDKPSRDYDYLLPLSPDYFALLGEDELDISLTERGSSTVEVTLRHEGRNYSHTYRSNDIKDLRSAKANVALALFPNVLSPDADRNNYFKLFLVPNDHANGRHEVTDGTVALTFFRHENGSVTPINEVEDTKRATFGVLPRCVRSTEKTPEASESSTVLYELFNTAFSLVGLSIAGHTGLLLPRWRKSIPADKSFTYAIDLGTSNTFVSRTEKDSGLAPDLFQFDQPMMSFLHEAPKDAQRSLVQRIESSLFAEARERVATEFMPPLIDGTDYRFPIRTALCTTRKEVAQPRLFDSHNIAFFYERTSARPDQNICTDIKWDTDHALLRLFIRQLLLMIKTDVLQREGRLSDTRIIWFRPLSFRGDKRRTFEAIWQEETAQVLGIDADNVSCITESEAPYYYFNQKGVVRNLEAVSVIDIGGGTTDMVYFNNSQPKIASSVQFGGDVLWSNGYNKFENAHLSGQSAEVNGIFTTAREVVKFHDTSLSLLNDSLLANKTTKTKDILNFWLKHQDDSGFSTVLREKFKPVFAYHLVATLYYMASTYHTQQLSAPKTLVFSGNGSRYIDQILHLDETTVARIAEVVLRGVYGGDHAVNVRLPQERKEATCYGGLYRPTEAESPRECTFQGDTAHVYDRLGEVKQHSNALFAALDSHYRKIQQLFGEVLQLLRDEELLPAQTDTKVLVQCAGEELMSSLRDQFQNQFVLGRSDDDKLHDTVFFLPIIGRIFALTHCSE